METMKIADVAEQLYQAKLDLSNALSDEAALKFNFDAAEAVALTSGQITGKNEAERKAQLSILTRDLRDALSTAERLTIKARFWHDCMTLRWEQIKLELRNEELVKGVTA